MTHQSPHEQLVPILTQRQDGYVDEAIAQLQTLLQHYPKFVNGWLELGHSWRMQGDRTQACTCYRTLLEFAPNHLSAHLQLAQELSVLGDEASAQAYLNIAAEKHPQNPWPLVKLGELALNQQDIDMALHWFDQAIQLDPTHPAAYGSKAKALRTVPDFPAALATLDLLFQHHPRHFWGCFHRGKIAQQQDDHTQALHWFRQAHKVATTPLQQRDAQLWMLEALQTLKHWDEAKSIASDLASTWPRHLPTQQRYAAILHGAGEIRSAIALYETLLDTYPDRPNLLAPLADCARTLGQTPPELEILNRIEARVETLWQSHAHPPQLIHCLLRLGERCQRYNERATALTYFHRILALDPHHFWANLKVAIAARNTGDFNSAATRLQQILEHHR
ncbi:MAG: tetratricopeptide repeat protein, partial [Cyanothece sp. SIO2G6]|nr:tetratricopeptide repeat protein [Cyanothece sp. SIO2G6]